MRIQVSVESVDVKITDDEGNTLLHVKSKGYTLDANPDGLVAAITEIGEAVERTLQ